MGLAVSRVKEGSSYWEESNGGRGGFRIGEERRHSSCARCSSLHRLRHWYPGTKSLTFSGPLFSFSISFSLLSSLQMFSVGPNFKGIKMIPPGIHFIYYSTPSNRWVIWDVLQSLQYQVFHRWCCNYFDFLMFLIGKPSFLRWLVSSSTPPLHRCSPLLCFHLLLIAYFFFLITVRLVNFCAGHLICISQLVKAYLLCLKCCSQFLSMLVKVDWEISPCSGLSR